MKTYYQAIVWLAANDDCSWIKDDKHSLSVSAALVMYIFDKTRGELINDFKKREEVINDLIAQLN